MKELRYTSQFKKDLKRFLNQPKKLTALNDVLDMLTNEIPLPEKYRQHALQGNYAGCLECHIDGDFLLLPKKWKEFHPEAIIATPVRQLAK